MSNTPNDDLKSSAKNRTHVDSGALAMALSVLRRAGKAEFADTLEATAVRGETLESIAPTVALDMHPTPVQPADPMDWPLPCDVTVGHATIGKGCKLSALVTRLRVLNDMVQEQNKLKASPNESITARLHDNTPVAPPLCGVAHQKLDELLAEGWALDGYGIRRTAGDTVQHGLVTTGGRVLWWHGDHRPAQPLTDDQIIDIGNEVHISMPDDADEQQELLAIAREIEQAHGIVQEGGAA